MQDDDGVLGSLWNEESVFLSARDDGERRNHECILLRYSCLKNGMKLTEKERKKEEVEEGRMGEEF